MDARLRVFNRRRLERTARRASLPTREQLVPGEDELLSHYRSTIGCRFIRQWYTASAEPRRRADKASGRKRPRAGDVDIVPAGDVATALTADWRERRMQVCLPDGKKIEDNYSFLENTWTWRTDGQTDTARRHRSRLCVASCGKKRSRRKVILRQWR